jgi:hypothetical protein
MRGLPLLPRATRFDNGLRVKEIPMMIPRLTARFLLGVLLLFSAAGLPAGASDWPPVPPEELALKDSPTHPGSHALILYRKVRRGVCRR